MRAVRVLLVDDDREWLAALADFFHHQPNLTLVAGVTTWQEAVSVLAGTPVDVVLLDVVLSGRDDRQGLDAAAYFHANFPRVRIIMLSAMDQDDDTFLEAFLNGAYDYIYKYEVDQLPAVIHAAMAGKASKYGERLRSLLLEKKRALLQPADKEVLTLLAAGHTRQEVAALQHVTEGAVKKRISRLLKKFRWRRSSRELALRCQLWGLLDEN